MSLFQRIFGKSAATEPAKTQATAEELAELREAVLTCFNLKISPRQNPVLIKGYWYGIGSYPLVPSHIPRSDGVTPVWYRGLWMYGECPSCQRLRPTIYFPTFNHHDTRDWKSFQGDHRKTPEYKAAYNLNLAAHTAQCKAQLAAYTAKLGTGGSEFQTYCPHCRALGTSSGF